MKEIAKPMVCLPCRLEGVSINGRVYNLHTVALTCYSSLGRWVQMNLGVIGQLA